jgi:hypothetical protein
VYIGVKVSYDEEGRPEERFFTVRFWRLDLRFQLSLQPAIDEQKAFAAGVAQEPRDPAVQKISDDLEREMFAADMFAAGVSFGMSPLAGLPIVGLGMAVHHEEETPEKK